MTIGRRTLLGALGALSIAIPSTVLVAHDPPKKAAKPGSMPAMASDSMHAAMMKGCKRMQMTGEADHDFAMMMSMHHKAAVEMAQIELKQGRDPKMQEMARNIIAAQEKEIAEFDAWMKDHPPAKPHAH